jgi:hypothetical protein
VPDRGRCGAAAQARILFGRGHRDDELTAFDERLETEEGAAAPLDVNGLQEQRRVEAGVEAHHEPARAMLGGCAMATEGPLAVALMPLAVQIEATLNQDGDPEWPRHGAGARRRFARADDCRPGVRVDAVGRADLDVDEATVPERGAELGLGKRPGHAAGPLLHVGAGGGVHAVVGDHV